MSQIRFTRSLFTRPFSSRKSAPAPMRVKHRLHAFIWHSVLILLVVGLLLPFAWLILTSLKSLNELDIYPIRWLPRQAEWNNYAQALTLIDFLGYAKNSFVLATINSILTTLTSALVGFGFARLRGRGKQAMFLIMLSTIMLPPIITTIPTFVIFANLHLVNTYWPWVLWGLASSPFLTFLFRQFFSSIPLAIEEAAIVDGANYFRIFWQFFLPLSRPVIATSLVLSFSAVWGDWLTPAIFLNQNNTTLAVAMSLGYADPNIPNLYYINVLCAGVVFYLLPVLLIFFFAQRSFTRGIVTTGMKG
jgi:ABC-type glycerol-3-phosphate transport system permease component